MNIEGIRKNYPASNLYSQKNENTNNTSLPKEINNTYFRGHFDKYSDKNVILNPTFSKSDINKLAQNNNISFKGLEKENDVLDCNELSDEEFEKIRPKVEEKLKEHFIYVSLNKNNILLAKIRPKVEEKLKERFIYVSLNKNNILLADKILSNERLYNNENIMNKIGDIISSTNTPEEEKVKSAIIDKILSDERLYNNENFMNQAGDIIRDTNTPEKAKVKSDMIDKILSDERVYNNKEFMNQAGDIIRNTNTPEQAKFKSDMLDKILSDEKLYDNEKVINNAANIISRINTPNQAQIAEKILSNEKLYNNENFMKYAEEFINRLDTIDKAQIADKILSDEKLYNNENFMNKASDIIYYTKTLEQAKILDKILSNERLYNNKLIMSNPIGIIASTESEDALKTKSVILDKIVSSNILDTPIGNSLFQLLSKYNPYKDAENLDKFFDYYTKNGLDEHNALIQSAFANKDLLKSGLEDISDKNVLNVMSNIDTARTLHLIGLGNTEAAFPLMLEEFKFFTKDVAGLNLSPENYERLIQKTNYKNSQKYAELPKQISSLKSELINSISPENQSKMKKLHAQKEILDNRIKELKQKNDNDSQKELKDLQKQSKALGSQIQSIYFTSPNAKDLMKEISSKTKELNDMMNTSKSLEPQEIVTKMRVLSGLKEIASEDEMAYFIDLIKPSTPENNANWNNEVNKKIFKKLGVEYDEELSNKLDLINCPYLSKMFVSSKDFFANMKILVDVIKENPDLSVEQAIDRMPQNIETKKIYNDLGIDYDKWTKVDKNSYTSVEITLDAEAAKQKAIENLEEDLNDDLFKKLPKDATEPILKRLENNLGVTLEKSQKDNWVGDGFSAGSSDYYRLYKNGKPIAFEDMKDIVSEIKKEINSNDFWTTKNENPEIETARGTLYTHLIKMRTNEVDNALNIKDGETAEIEVRKTDMYDVKKALGLGNDAQCCTALGRNFNEWSAPTYIMNKCIGAIELTDKGAFAGNTMIYIAKVDGKPSLVLDNIELKTKYQNNDKLRDTFVDYAKKLCKEIGQPDLPIYAGPNRHKLNMDIYPKSKHSMEIIGNSADQEVYVDYDADGHQIGNGEIANIEMYKLR